MGLNLLRIAGGFAKAATKEIEKEEKLATERGTAAAKTLYQNYVKVNEENIKKAKELAEDMQWLKDKDPNASPEMLAEVARNRPFMDFIKQKAKSENFDPSSVQLSKFVKMTEGTPTASVIDQLNSSFDATKIANEMFKKQESTGNVFRDLTATSRQRAYETSFRETLGGAGVSPEEMQAAISKRGTQVDSKAQIDYTFFKKEKTFDQQENDAKIALLNATKENNVEKINAAKADLLVINSIKTELTSEQTKFANKIADIKNRYMFGTPEERAAAKPEYDKMLADVRAEAAAKKAGEGKEDKIPTLGTLNTFTSAAVARKVAEVHGDLVRNKQLAIIEKPDGSASLEYTGDNPELRAKINTTAYNAAKNALSLYMTPTGEPMTRDVAAVLNTYVPQSVMREAEPAPTSAPTAPRSAVPAPASNTASLRRDAEAAIARGADRAAVAKRFKDQTGQEL